MTFTQFNILFIPVSILFGRYKCLPWYQRHDTILLWDYGLKSNVGAGLDYNHRQSSGSKSTKGCVDLELCPRIWSNPDINHEFDLHYFPGLLSIYYLLSMYLLPVCRCKTALIGDTLSAGRCTFWYSICVYLVHLALSLWSAPRWCWKGSEYSPSGAWCPLWVCLILVKWCIRLYINRYVFTCMKLPSNFRHSQVKIYTFPLSY